MADERDEARLLLRRLERRTFVRRAAAGTVVAAVGGLSLWLAHDSESAAARKQLRPDGRARLPPGQRVVHALKPMGGEAGDAGLQGYRLKVFGAVERPLELGYRELMKVERVEQSCDVHCVTGWSLLGGVWTGVRVRDLARQARVKPSARHVIFEAAWGYTANVPLSEALADNVLVATKLDGHALGRAHGAPVRALVPDLYFWKSAKWLWGIRFAEQDEPGFWEVRGYHNHGDPWGEQRYG
jgi:DMSO/TMAO reductase YedYZ molybdopterin-dependent catalytic subunit